MIESTDTYQSSTGYSVHRREFTPDDGGTRHAGLIFLHGLGDHSGRHQRHLRYFAERGIHCVGIDLPGHGLTGGKRGYISGGMKTVEKLVGENIAYLREFLPEGAKIGIAGHSMGGFLSLHYLTENPEDFDFAWISSPLIDPAYRVSRFTRWAGRLLGAICPRYTLRSKVRSTMCKRDPEEIESSRKDPLVHRCLTLSLGIMLLKHAPSLSLRCRNLSPDLNLMITHGSEDEVCPSALSRLYYDQLTLPRKRFELFDGLLHEPFNDIGREKVFDAIEDWLDALGFEPHEGEARGGSRLTPEASGGAGLRVA
jgi:alpha-beta hydrolase superfamily lysophospholipase